MNDDGTIGAPNPTNQYEFFPSMDWPGGPHELLLKDEQRSYMVGSIQLLREDLGQTAGHKKIRCCYAYMYAAMLFDGFHCSFASVPIRRDHSACLLLY